MRIHGFGTGSVEDRERLKADSSTASNAQASQVPVGQSSVVVSTGAQEISAAVTRSSAAQGERVASVRAQIQSGTYQVDRGKLADKIADDEYARAGQA